MNKVNIQVKQEGQTLDATEVNQIVAGLNETATEANEPSHSFYAADFIEDGVEIVGGVAIPVIKINPARVGDSPGSAETPATIYAKLVQNAEELPDSILPPVVFGNMTGSGTDADPYIITTTGGQVSAEAYLKSLPGYGVDKMLYSDLTWGPIPEGSLDKLETPVIIFATPTGDSVGVSWAAIFGATSYKLERALDVSFANPITVYEGAGLSQTDIGLTPLTNYKYRLRATGAGYSASSFGTGQATTGAAGNTTPAAPTNGVVNNSADTFGFTLVPGIALAGNYEQSLDGGTTITNTTVNPIVVGDTAKSAGQVKVRVKAASGRNAGPWLENATPFTVAVPLVIENTLRLNLMNVYGSTNVPGWNNWNPTTEAVQINDGPVFTPLLNPESVSSGASVKVTKGFNGNSMTTGNYTATSPIYPIAVINSGFLFDNTGSQLTFKLLNPAKYYQIYILPTTTTNVSTSKFTINGVEKTKVSSFPLDGGNEYTDPALVVFNDVQCNSNGDLLINMINVSGHYQSAINAIVIQQTNTLTQ